MVAYCCAYNCKEVFKKGGPVTFHGFPKDPERRKLWEIKLKRVNFKATDYSKICSKHFKTDCFDNSKFGGTWLKPDAVPTIFGFVEVLDEETSKKSISRQPPEKRVIAPDENSSGTVASTSKAKRLHYLGDFDVTDVQSPTKAQKMLKASQAEVATCKQVIKKLQRENKCLKKRVASLSSMLQELKDKKMISDDASAVLKLSLPGAASEFINRLELPSNKAKYSPELRAFALTLNFYSAKAYDYVRKTFLCNLPHPTTLRKW